VFPEERSAAITAGFLFAHPATISLPFFLASTIKIIYDILLYRAFVHLTHHER
jgi:hypothetical protein